MCGGDESVFNALKHNLGAMGKSCMLLGPVGCDDDDDDDDDDYSNAHT